MNNTLSITTNTKKGFTLIELMVVIAIIAVLSLVGIAVFTGQAKASRDARRKADIEAIAQAMESQKAQGATVYTALAANFFASGAIPVDATNTTVAPDSACPGVCKYCVLAASGPCTIASTAVGVGAPGAAATWFVCANLEAGGNYCRGNAQ